MNNSFLLSLSILLVSLMLLTGCSGGADPIVPDNPELLNVASDVTEKPASPLLWGLWDVVIDPDTFGVECKPLRTAEFTVNVNMYLQPPAGSTSNMAFAVTDTSNYASQGEITVDVTLTHPFPSNPEFTGFDVMGVFMHNGSHQSAVGYNNMWPRYPTDAVLLNHDGLTRWMNQSEFTSTGLLGFTSGIYGSSGSWTATINPYKYFADGLSKTQSILNYYSSGTPIANRGKFGAGNSNTREYLLQFPMSGGNPVLTFQYAVIARWDNPANNPPVNIPGDFPATANCQESFYIEVRDAGSTLNYHTSTGGSGSLIIDIEVFDWQGASNPLGFSNELIGLFVEGVNNWVMQPINFTDVLGTSTQSAGTCANSRIFHAFIPNCVPTQTGFEQVMINAQSNSPADYDSGFGSNYPVGAALSGYTIADIPVTNYSNSTPSVPVPTGPAYVWEGQTVTFTCAASDVDPGDTLTYTWSIVTSGTAANYSIPGDPIQPGTNTLTITMSALGGYPPGTYDISCQVQDSSGQPNDTGYSPMPLVENVYVAPYTGGTIVIDQVIVPGMPSLQGGLGCPAFWDCFYGLPFAIPFNHADISILSGPSLGIAGVMVICDEFGALTGVAAPPVSFAHYTCPYATGNLMAWSWTTLGVPPFGPDVVPSVVHFDGNINAEFFITTSMNMISPYKIPGVPDPSIVQHYTATPTVFNGDLYTSLFMPGSWDIGADTTNGFDMGSPSSPDNPPLYALYTQDQSGILNFCTNMPPPVFPSPGPLDPFPVNILQFPSGGVQPGGVPVDAGGPGIVAPLPQSLVSIPPAGPGIFCIGPGGPSPSGGMVYADPYYAIAVDDDPDDNPVEWLELSTLPKPINQWVLAATIDAERDLEIYEVDFGVPTPAPIQPWSSLPFGAFMGGQPNIFPLDCEFCSNFSGFAGTTNHIANEDILAVLLTDPIAGVFLVEIFIPTPGMPTSITVTPAIPIPPMNYGGVPGVGGVAYRLDVDEVTGDIYVIHESAAGGGGLGVTIFSY